MKQLSFLLIPILLLVFSAFFRPASEDDSISYSSTPIATILERFGEPPLPHKPDLSIKGVSAEMGEKLVLTGFALKPNGGQVAKQSAHFVCTSCHNVVRDEPNLRVVDPQARLEYAEKMGLPFLQGTALYGIINRTSFYNGDYDKKYGDLVKPARNNLREAIQLCAVECAQGRALNDWEMESILAYLWKIDLKLGDLDLTEDEIMQITIALKERKGEYPELVKLIKSRYLQDSPATFVTPPENRKEGYVEQGDPTNGKRVYDLSCKHCHEEMRYSFFNLDDKKSTFQFLKKHMPKYTRYSIYQVGRYGTSPLPGKRAYMPQYPLEKMSNQQLEDLRAYIEQEAG